MSKMGGGAMRGQTYSSLERGGKLSMSMTMYKLSLRRCYVETEDIYLDHMVAAQPSLPKYIHFAIGPS